MWAAEVLSGAGKTPNPKGGKAGRERMSYDRKQHNDIAQRTGELLSAVPWGAPEFVPLIAEYAALRGWPVEKTAPILHEIATAWIKRRKLEEHMREAAEKYYQVRPAEPQRKLTDVEWQAEARAKYPRL
jgi:hypothetical protein